MNFIALRKAVAAPHEDCPISTGKPPVEVLADDGQTYSAQAICAISNLLTDDRSPMLNRGSKAQPRPPSDTQLAAQDIRSPRADTGRKTAIHRPASQANMENQIGQRKSFWDTSRQCQYYDPRDQEHRLYHAFGGGADTNCLPIPGTMSYPWLGATAEGPIVVQKMVTYSKPADRKSESMQAGGASVYN